MNIIVKIFIMPVLMMAITTVILITTKNNCIVFNSSESEDATFYIRKQCNIYIHFQKQRKKQKLVAEKEKKSALKQSNKSCGEIRQEIFGLSLTQTRMSVMESFLRQYTSERTFLRIFLGENLSLRILLKQYPSKSFFFQKIPL